MNTMSRSFHVSETICDDLLARLSSDPSDAARAFCDQARGLLRTVHGWRVLNPTQEERGVILARVMDLHRAAREYLAEAHGGVAAQGASK
jgi:hypothetical protein